MATTKELRKEAVLIFVELQTVWERLSLPITMKERDELKAREERLETERNAILDRIIEEANDE